ncbi:MAG: PH domain-containing protein [Corallococcus sp.]|nr:PH domain-containing protein [Corallococcus sp.]
MNINEKYFQDSELQDNSIEDVLNPNEEILWRDKPNKGSYIWAQVIRMMPIAIVWLLIDGFFIGFITKGMISGDIPTDILWFVILFFLLHLTPVWIWIAGIVKSVAELKNLEYAITDKRVIVRSGVVGIDFKFLNYVEIESVNVKVGIIDKIFKVGDVYINASTNSAVLFDIKNPYKIGKHLQKIVVDMKSDINYPNALRPQSNPGYKTKYDDNPFGDDNL